VSLRQRREAHVPGIVMDASVEPREDRTEALLRACLAGASFWWPRQLGPQPSWLEHAPFAFWLVGALRPRVLVELGTHGGFSYFTLCEGVQRHGLGTSCYAVDTWKGDEHAGFYGEEVYAQVRAHQDRFYSAFSTLIRSTFDAALPQFGDGTIDLLHVDGRHLYGDVRHDFESWRAKMSDRGVVLFHDTNVREGDFGVFRFWEEVRAHYPHFEFMHGHGLGVLGVGSRVPEAVRDLFAAAAEPETLTRVRDAYARLGAALSLQMSAEHKSIELAQKSADETAARRRADDLTAALEARSSEIARLTRELASAQTQVAQVQISWAEERMQFAAKLAAQNDRLIELAAQNDRVVELAARNDQLVKQAAPSAALEAAQARIGDLEARTAALSHEIAELRLSTAPPAAEPLPAGKAPLASVVQSALGLPLVLCWRIIKMRSLAPLRDARGVLAIARSGRFDRAWYLARNPDVAAGGFDPIVHYVMFGVHEGREPSPSFNSRAYLAGNFDVAVMGMNPFAHFVRYGEREGRSGSGKGPGTESRPQGLEFESASGVMAHLMAPTDAPFNDDGYFITRFMHYIWQLRPDLKPVFDLADKRSRLDYCKWFLIDASREYGLSPKAYPDQLLAKLAACGGIITEKARSVLDEKRKLIAAARSTAEAGAAPAKPDAYGANIIGYCRGEFGMGEFTRTAVRSFDAARLPFSVIDCPEVGSHGSSDTSIAHLISGTQRFKTNIFVINADILPSLYFKFGESFFGDHFNVGYWAWELPECPPEFDIALGMVDEVWALSDFTADSFRTRSSVPVFSMPLAVSVPALQRQYAKTDFGLADDSFAFLFTFDAASYLGRKNPIGAVRAFKQAFPRGREKVSLLLKTMNVPTASPLWDALLAEAGSDPRIQIMNRRLSRDEVVGLSSVCDAVVSLHRSEGFGLTVAEAMLLGKPVVVTNYSGTRNFAREDTACVVDFKLVPVPAGQYPFWQNQVWAEPDIGHAASLMRRLVEDEPYRTAIARAGKSFVSDNLNERAVGARYAMRLEQLKQNRFRTTRSDRVHARQSMDDAGDVMVGSIDLPAPDAIVPQCGAIEVSGWFASRNGIESVEVFCDGKPVGRAHHGILRPDVGNAYPYLQDAAHAGFSHIVDSEALAGGPHRLRVVANARDGREGEVSRDFSLSALTAYALWLKNNTSTTADKEALAARVAGAPLITLVLVCGREADRAAIAATLRSIANQAYSNFEVLVVPAAGGAKDIDALAAAAGIADRSRAMPASDRGLQDALPQVRGEFVALLEAGDVLDPRALLAVAENVARDPTIDFLYADEDRIAGDGRSAPDFKPSYSPIYLESRNYVGRPWFARRGVLSSAVDAGEANEAAFEHPLVRRIGRAARTVGHIPAVLLSRQQPRAGGREAPLSPDIAVEGPWPRVSVVIPTCLKNRDIVATCLSGLFERTDYPDAETIVVVNNVGDVQEARDFLGQWAVQVLVWERPYTWSGINNFAARHARGDHLLFLNDDVEPLAPDWLKQMVRLGRIDAVGAVGALLRYPNGTIQHAGVTVSNRTECGRHLFRYRTGREPAVARIVGRDRECTAVTGACLLTPRTCFDALGGFDEDLQLVANDIDYCLRLRERGYATVLAGHAALTHHEGLSRGAAPETGDIERFWERWRPRLAADDPFTNPNLSAQTDDWSVDPAARATLVARISRKR